MISPCMLMVWQSAIAAGKGCSVLPYVISSTTDVVGNVTEMKSAGSTKQLFSPETAAYVRELMVSNGTRYSDSIPGYSLGLKSGTAQVKNGEEENSFLTGFNTHTDKPIAFCVLIENKDEWGITTDSIVSALLDAL